jgi:hypothetical protein
MFLISLLPRLALYFLGLSMLVQQAQDGSPAFGSPAAPHAVSLFRSEQKLPALATTTRSLVPHRNDLVQVSPPVALYPPLHRNQQHLVHIFPPPFAPYPPLAPGAPFYKDEDAMVLDENSHLKRSHQQLLIDTADYHGKQQIVLAGINAADYHGEQQSAPVALESIDTADYHGAEDDDDM